MLKHIMLIACDWNGVRLDAWMCAKWPMEGWSIEQIDALQVMLDGKLPPELSELKDAYWVMLVRKSTQANTRLVILDDEYEGIKTREAMELYLKHASKEHIQELIAGGR